MVNPAADMPKKTAEREGGKLVIINLQATPLDDIAFLKIHGRSDIVMRGVMQELGLEIPPFVLRRRVGVSCDAEGRNIKVEGIDNEGIPITLFRWVELKFEGTERETSQRNKGPRDKAELASFVFSTEEHERGESSPGEGRVRVEMNFMEHYKEPAFPVQFKIEKGREKRQVYRISYNPLEDDKWTFEEESTAHVAERDGQGEESSGEKEKDKPGTDKEKEGIVPCVSRSYPAELDSDKVHVHPLILVDGAREFRCTICEQTGIHLQYQCQQCDSTIHPTCAIWRRKYVATQT